MRRNRTRRDANEPRIVEALEQAGCDVYKLDFPCDLLVGRAGTNYLLEVKHAQTRGHLTENERKFGESWRGEIRVITNVNEALHAVGLLRRR